MTAVLALEHLFLCLALVLGGGPGCAGGPDELELLYGHTFAGDSSLGESGGGGWPITNDDSDFLGFGLVWKLRPTRVEVVNPPVRWAMEPEASTVVPQLSEPQDPPADPPADSDDEHPSTLDHVQDDVVEIAEAFDAMDWITRVLIAVLAGWILFLYRKQLGRLIPGGKKGPNGD